MPLNEVVGWAPRTLVAVPIAMKNSDCRIHSLQAKELQKKEKCSRFWAHQAGNMDLRKKKLRKTGLFPSTAELYLLFTGLHNCAEVAT